MPAVKRKPGAPIRGYGSKTAVAAKAAGEARQLGLRERHKLDKFERISAAALTLFGRDGYDGTTVRDIASEADVALGTLSLYACDKHDLVLMIFNRVIPPLMERGRRKTNPTARLAKNLIAYFEPFYRAYAEQVTLYRIILAQVYNGPKSVHAAENEEIRVELLEIISEMIQWAVASGECRQGIDLGTQARSFFYLYFAAVRVWLFEEQPKTETGLAALKSLYEQHIAGISSGRQ